MIAIVKMFLSGFVKDFLGKIVLNMVLDTLKAMVLKLDWKIVIERVLSRIIVVALKWVKGLSTNEVSEEVADSIMSQMRDKGLVKAYDKEPPDKVNRM